MNEESLKRYRHDPAYTLQRGDDADLAFSIDNTALTAEEAAERIADRIRALA